VQVVAGRGCACPLRIRIGTGSRGRPNASSSAAAAHAGSASKVTAVAATRPRLVVQGDPELLAARSHHGGLGGAPPAARGELDQDRLVGGDELPAPRAPELGAGLEKTREHLEVRATGPGSEREAECQDRSRLERCLHFEPRRTSPVTVRQLWEQYEPSPGVTTRPTRPTAGAPSTSSVTSGTAKR
jgi:hypothetical protein